MGLLPALRSSDALPSTVCGHPCVRQGWGPGARAGSSSVRFLTGRKPCSEITAYEKYAST